MKASCLYLHGFNSGPESKKGALLAKRFFQKNTPFYAPRLPPHVGGVLSVVDNIIASLRHHNLTIIGSSLGGFFATYFAEKYQTKAVLINPAFEELFEKKDDYLGEHTNPYTGEVFYINEQHYHDLSSLWVDHSVCPEHYLLLLQTGDDVLDYRKALARFPRSKRVLQVGGSHRFDNFAGVLDDICEFMGI